MVQGHVDLHCHSIASDGTMTPAEVVELASKNGLCALSLTDHDTIDGVEEAASAASALGIDFVPGIEISCSYPRPGVMHLLGYGIDPRSPSLRTLTETLLAGRNRRNVQIVSNLNAIGIPFTIGEVAALAGGEVVGRPHIAQALVKRGIVSNTNQAFREYVGQGGKVWADKEQLTPRQSIAMIHESGGVAVLAHPTQLRKTNDAQLRSTIKDLLDLGLDGIEVIHSDHRESFVDKLADIARRHGMLMTGGSDFHGSNKSHIQLGRAGRRRVPREMYDALCRAIARR